MTGGDAAPLPELTLEADAFLPEQIAGIRDRLARLWHAAASRGPAGPFLLATPLGLARREVLEHALALAGVEISATTPVPFPAAATAVYVQHADDDELHRAAAFERLWEAYGEDRAAERWTLASMEAFARLLGAKRAVRVAVPSRAFRVRTPRGTFVARLHAFHAPDPDRLALEARLLAALLADP